MKVSGQHAPSATANLETATALRTDLPAAIYYRQSDPSAVGNTSTSMQTVDMVDHLIALGWKRDSILLSDLDQGVSGATGIEQRAGLRYLWALIELELIGTVAAVHVDRFFRELELIQTNQFIELCRRHHVHILTPTFVYEFDHPQWGHQHQQLFRLEAQKSADYLHTQVYNRLLKGQQRLHHRGLWAGGKIPVGYMVDNRKTLADSKLNPNWRKLVPFAPMASVVRSYFQIAIAHGGNLRATYQQIMQFGPFFPEESDTAIPIGYKHNNWPQSRSRLTGRLMLTRDGLRHLLKNPIYLGHWVVRGKVRLEHNHAAIVAEDIVARLHGASASSAIATSSSFHLPEKHSAACQSTTSTCQPTRRQDRRASTKKRSGKPDKASVAAPTYQGAVYCCPANGELAMETVTAIAQARSQSHWIKEEGGDPVWLSLDVRWQETTRAYVYVLPKQSSSSKASPPFYSVGCRQLEACVDSLVLQRLLYIQGNAKAIKQRQLAAITRDSQYVSELEHRLDALIYLGSEADQPGTRTGLGLIEVSEASLPLELAPSSGSGSDSGAGQHIDLSYALKNSIHNPLQHLQRLAASAHATFRLIDMIDQAVSTWHQAAAAQRRQIFDLMAEGVLIQRLDKFQYRLGIRWRDATLSPVLLVKSTDHYWSPADWRLLESMFQANQPQEEILAAFPTRTWRSIVHQYALYRKQQDLDSGRLRYRGERCQSTMFSSTAAHQVVPVETEIS